MTEEFNSWGRYKTSLQRAKPLWWRWEDLAITQPGEKVLPYGLGRSYGDSCLNTENTILLTRDLNHFLDFEPHSGLLTCEAGTSLQEVLDFFVPRGWFLPVTPGTKFVTVGGALANDVHGKNHHRAGSFGHHVTQFELVRSGGERLICSANQNAELFLATIGGLGLTGLVTWVQFKLSPIVSDLIDQEVMRFGSVKEFFDLSEQYKEEQYTVAWIDCLATHSSLGRGHFITGHHHPTPTETKRQSTKKISIPFDMPQFVLNPWSVRLFNSAYFHRQLSVKKKSTGHYDGFFYPLDKVYRWNRIYGKRGFYQYQCVVPLDGAFDVVSEILKIISQSGKGSFLSVLKTFGDFKPVGLLSFPRPGVTLALDFANSGSDILTLMDTLDGVVISVGGAVYPAKDARMSRDTFEKSFPKWREFTKLMDPRFSSDFSRRVGMG